MMGWICPICGTARPPHWDQCCTAPVAHKPDALTQSTDAVAQSALAQSPVADVVALEPKTKRRSTNRRSYDDPFFDEFWSVYPHKVDKLKAQGAFHDALARGALAQSIIDGARQYAWYCRINAVEVRHMKYAQGWLNADRWNDELSLPAAVGEGPSHEEQQSRRIAEENRAIEEMS